MPKNDKRRNGFENTHPEDLAAKEEKFRTFFSTSVAQVPDEMKRRDDDQKNPDTGKPGILSRILGRAKEEAAAEPAEEPKAQPQELPPTGEIRLGGEEEAAEPEADLELAADFFAPETPAQTPAAPEARPAPAPKAAAPAAPKPEKPAAPKLEKNYVRGPLTPQEQKEQSEMQELKALLFPETPPAKAEKPMEVKNAPQEVLGVETEALEDEEKAAQPPLPKMVFAEDVARAEKAAATAPATPKAEPEEPTKPFRFFGVGDDENAPAAPTRETAPGIDDSMSIPLVGMDDTAPIEVTAAEAEAGTEAKPETAAPAPTETPAETPDAPAEAAPEEEAVPETPEQVGDKLHKMGAELTLRCVLSGILAVVLLHFGLVAAGLHPSPVPYADIVTTTTHKTLRGPRGGLILSTEELAPAINKAIFPGNQGGPLMHIIAAKAVCFGEALAPEFKEYQKNIVSNCSALANGLLSRGVRLVSGGTDNHLILVDLRSLGVTGKELEHRLDEVYITANKNSVPNDPEKPFVTSGIRLGTAAVTSRGLNEQDMDTIADFVYRCAVDFEGSADDIRRGVCDICRRYPLYE